LEEEIVCAVQKLKAGKAAGPDEILSEMITAAPQVIVPLINKLFNAIFAKGQFPKAWSRSTILPIYKRGDSSVPDNYRGISLTSIFSQVFTSILADRLRHWAETNDLIVEEQAGFRKGYSTVDNIFVLHSIIQRYLKRRKKVYAAFVDFKKAFDTVDRSVLWEILFTYGVRGKMLRMLQGIYSLVLSCVRGSGDCTDSFECHRGLKQGCKMSPIIFSLMVNYVAKMVIRQGKHGIQLFPDSATIYLILFADDIVLISDTVVGLQNQLSTLKEGADTLGLIVNEQKTKVMVFRNGGHLAEHEKWFLGKVRLEIVNEYRYLGTVFSTRLSLNTLQLDLTRRARAGMLQVMKCMHKLDCVSPDLFFKLFDAQVQSALLYSSELWGLTECSVVEAVHLQAIKRFLNVPTKTPNVFAYGESGRHPLYINAAIRAVKYWFKILSMDAFRYPHKVYLMMLNSSGGCNWADAIKSVLCKHGFEQVWKDQGTQSVSMFLRELKQRLISEYRSDWSSALFSSSRYSFYRQFKSDWSRENYLNAIDKRVFRSMYIRFRTGFSDLFLHKYRFTNDGSDNMYTCPACCENVECEAHFLLECPVYEDLRRKYFSNLPNSIDRGSVGSLLSTQDTDSIRSIAVFLYHAFKRRHEAVEIAIADEAYTM